MKVINLASTLSYLYIITTANAGSYSASGDAYSGSNDSSADSEDKVYEDKSSGKGSSSRIMDDKFWDRVVSYSIPPSKYFIRYNLI